MMMSIDSIKSNLYQSLQNYQKFRVLDASLLNDPMLQQELKTETQSYNYTNTKLVAITHQRKKEYIILDKLLDDIAQDGVLNAELAKSVTIDEIKKSGDRDDDGAAAITTSNAGILKQFGVGALATDSTLSKQQKQALAAAYLKEMDNINTRIKDLTKEELMPKSTDPKNNVQNITKNYAETKKVYIAAVKKALADNIITPQGDTLEKADAKAKLEGMNPNDKLDFKAETSTGKTGMGANANKNAVVANLKKIKTQLEGYQAEGKNLKLDDLDALLKNDAYEVDSDKLKKATETEAFKEQAKKAAEKSTTASNPLASGAKSLEKTLAALKKEKGDDNIGITAEKFDEFINTNADSFEKFYKTQKQGAAPTLPTFDEIFNETTQTETNAEGKEVLTTQIKNETPGAEEANRSNSLAKENIGKPIAISTQRDNSPIDVGSVKIKGIPVQITFEPEETQVNKNSANKDKLLMSTFRGQPAVISQKDGKYFMRFYDTQKAGNGHVVTMGIAEVDPKLVFKNKEFTQPKTDIDVSMLKKDAKGRKVIDYYVRSYDKDGYTNDDKVLYVARNFADSIDRLPSVRAAQYFAALQADPVNFKTKQQQEASKLQNKASTDTVDLSLEPKPEDQPAISFAKQEL